MIGVNMEKFTPGPWAVRTYDLMQTIEANGYPVALPCMNDHVSAIECGANARLIALAPEMRKALQRLTHPMADDSDLENALEVISRACQLSTPVLP